MRYKFYREHKYVSFALNELERLVAKIDFREKKEVEEMKARFDSVFELLHSHAEYENTSLHELLRKKGSSLYKEAEKDHAIYEEKTKELQRLLKRAMEAKGDEEKIEQGYQFYLAFRKFVGENLLHLHEEETVILPELQRLYKDEELKCVERETYQRMTGAELSHMLEELFPHMNPSDWEAFLSDIKEAEPEKFKEAWESISPTFSQKEKSRLIKKLKI